ncbi:recombination-associated protein RdgC [Mergibacter septicus]|uniref:recombination-associated protein RdgC n=1 Tax=Mergibacter septicus TaxID=221402 RepID=UPI001C799FD9|nr:recombination-associated protein RdgC [Mergibacter septicus]QDJ13614.1 recombination-associated protein RdgC [Mergibacter septicus]
MMWFKNLMVYRLTKPLDWQQETLETALAENRFIPCSPQDQSKFGWISPLKGSEMLSFYLNGQFLLLARKEEKILPATVVKKAVDERITELEQAQQRKLKKIEKQAIKDDVLAMLLPRAFSRQQHTAMWIDSQSGLIYVESASSKRAEEALALLRKSLGSLPVVPLMFNQDIASTMTQWLKSDEMPNWLNWFEEVELTAENGGVVRCKQLALDSEEVLGHLHSGKLVTKLGLDLEDRFSLVFQDDGSYKRLKFSDIMREKNDDILKEDYAQRFEADFLLQTEEIKRFTEKLIAEFGGIKESA